MMLAPLRTHVSRNDANHHQHTWEHILREKPKRNRPKRCEHGFLQGSRFPFIGPHVPMFRSSTATCGHILVDQCSGNLRTIDRWAHRDFWYSSARSFLLSKVLVLAWIWLLGVRWRCFAYVMSEDRQMLDLLCLHALRAQSFHPWMQLG